MVERVAMGYLRQPTKGVAAMNPRVAVTAALLFAAAAIPAGVRADVSTDVQTQLKSAYQNQCKLIQDQNFDGYAKTLTDDYYTNDSSGKKIVKADAITQMKSTVASTAMKPGECAIDFTASTQSGSDVTVNALVVQTAQATVQGKEMPLQITTRELDTWTNAGGGWLQKASTVKGQVVKSGDKIIEQDGSLDP